MISSVILSDWVFKGTPRPPEQSRPPSGDVLSLPGHRRTALRMI